MGDLLGDRAFHEVNAIRGQTDPEGALAELDARYHDHLPEGANCHLCGVEHAAINPSSRLTAREEREEMLADRELMRDEMHGRTDW